MTECHRTWIVQTINVVGNNSLLRAVKSDKHKLYQVDENSLLIKSVW